LKQVGKRYSRVRIREIYSSKTQNLGIQTNVMNTENKSQSKKNIQFTQKLTKSASNDTVQQTV